MSTYTDLHMRRRENLTILRRPGAPDDGITPQRVIFANPENIYEGTFKGRFEAKGVSFTSVDMTDCLIAGGILSDVAFKTGSSEIMLTDLTSNISETQENILHLQDFQTSAEISCSTFVQNIDFLSNHLSVVELSVDQLSGYVDSLSNVIDESIRYSKGISSYLSDTICSLVSIDDSLSSSLSTLSTVTNERIEKLQNQVVGGLVYKGSLSIDAFDQSVNHPISNLFTYNGWNSDAHLSTGYMFIALASNHTDIHYSFDGVELEHGDWLIIKENCLVNSITSAKVDVFDAQDYDNFKLSNDNVVYGNNTFNGENALNGETTFNGKTNFKGDVAIDASLAFNSKIDFLSNVDVKGQLSTNSFIANDARINKLSISLSDVSYENGLCSLQNLSSDIYKNIYEQSSDIDIINDRLLSVDDTLKLHDIKLSNHMQYYGAFTKYDVTVEQLSSQYLSVFLDNNLNLNFEDTIQLGFMAKFISSMTLIDSHDVSVNVFNNDYIICNKDVVLSDAQLSDFDFIRDAQIEVENAISNEMSARIFNDNVISSWLIKNFANTGDDTDSSTTILKQDVSANSNLSVASNAYVLSDLSIAGSLYVNGAQLGITIEKDSGTGETETVARTIADEVEFTTSLEEDAPTINITKNAISFSSAPVYVSTSSFIISNDQAKVIDATSSQVEILSVLNVESDKATITILSVGALSTDFSQMVDFASMSSILDISADLNRKMLLNDDVLSTSIDKKIFIDGLSTESLSAQHISQEDYYNLVSTDSTISNVLYIVSSENINAYGQRIENLAAPINLSDATTKEYVDNADANLSGYLSNLISSMYDSLSAIEVDETISSLNQKSCISAVISAVVGIRDTLASLRQTMSTILGI